MFVYVGSYTEAPYGDGPGISVFRLDDGSGTLAPVQTVGGVRNPSFLVAAADGAHVYATNELADGGVSAFARDAATGELTALNGVATHGADTCYVSVAPGGRHLLAVNYTGGSVAVVPIAADGSLLPASDVVQHEGSSVRADRQEGAHPHMIHASPDGEAIVVTDLGADAVFVYGFDANAGRLVGRPERTAPAATPGSGPRHFAFSPDGATLYVLNELTDTLTAYNWNGGSPSARQTVASLPGDYSGDPSGAHVLVSPDGRFVYASNRGHGSITVFAVDTDGQVRAVTQVPTGGTTPRGFGLDPTGRWLIVANQDAGTVATFRRDDETGLLEETGTVVGVKSPVTVAFVAE